MSNTTKANIEYSVQVNFGGIGLTLFAIFNRNRSVHDVLVGGGDITEWGPDAQLAPWLELDRGPLGGLLGGVEAWGEEIDHIQWE